MSQDPPPAPAPAPDQRFRADPAAPGVARDQLLDRPVALRPAGDGGEAALAGQARLLARLEHAGVPAVHDLIAGPGGSLLVQRRVEGVTLADAIAAAAAGMPPAELATPSSTVQTMLKACDVLASAHSRGVVHRRIAPAAILLGSYGQVLVPEWGGAQTSEPSSSRPDGLHQDVRGVAACLLAALVRRMPGADGATALLTEADPTRLPSALASILARALHSDAAQGYADMPALAQDLARWLEGQTPVTVEPGAITGMHRRLRRHSPRLAFAVLIIAALAALVALSYGRQLLDHWRWGAPVLVEDFADPSWKNRWSEPPNFHGMFKIDGNRLVSTAARSANIHFKQRLTVPVAIEYTGEMLSGSEPCDLSLTWNEGTPSGIGDTDGKPKAMRSLGVQSGGHGNIAFLMLLSGHRMPVAYKAEKLENGRRYRFRVEIEEACVSLYVDGQLKLRHEVLVPFVSGYVGLYGHYPGKAFSDVRIFQQTPSPGITPFAVGDHYFLQGEHALALPLYEQVLLAHGDRSTGQQARFRVGLVQWRQGRRSEALETWRPITVPALRLRADAYAVQGDKDEWMREAFAPAFAERYRKHEEQREMLRNAWRLIIDRLVAENTPDLQLTDRILALREQLFPEDDLARNYASNLLGNQSRFEDCLKRFPETQSSCMLALGRSGEVLSQGLGDVDGRVKAWQMQGDFAKMVDAPSINPVLRALALCKLGRGEELLNDPELRYPVLLHLGRAEDLLTTAKGDARAANEALISLGRWAEAAGPGIPECPGSGGSTVAKLLLGDAAAVEKSSPAIRWLQAAESGDAKSKDKLRPLVVLPRDMRYHEGWSTAAILLPVVERLAGDAKALEQLRPQLALFSGIYGKRPWYVARALLGEIPPEGVLEMPAVTEREAWHALTRGLCADLAGDAAAARTAYQDFSKLPLPKRLLTLNTPDPEIEWFVRWRLRALGG